ncbi:MAG: alpha/beta hydrolase, partial [Gammaproteobacteria bacterium]|nr:alpha/beta hydrolase [Gammaproteobacteria bacterium]
MKKALKILLGSVVVLLVSIFIYLTYTTAQNNAAPAAEAMAAMQSDAAVTVTMDDWLVMQPARVTPTTGIVFYAGAYCDVRGYAPMLKEVAAAGYLIVAPTMPFDFSIFAPDIADEVRAAYPEIDQ